ncbi:methylmalonyl Co-A mutase-associated GTPase MeaB [Aquihabitans sp. G128]|uniref:methylmalonyl Co-A mutase-associated GTPase MeaB n=1 Tax=Aquihabitans sp. G128 TaxID=2849779 RepID=UPI001C24355B|nr:methylmalonyl Co-A mutase-associated GTPase MeaB [Aquihabitans sp. G128]QXC63140.1 methylmalonyl Co-A mutase-associated GTPase MeaB [Aquihabitans sp. G128]
MAPKSTPDELVQAARTGDRAAVARLLSIVERGGSEAHQVGRATYALAGAAYTVGLTGAPGAGKSTLTSAVVAHVRRSGERLSVLAIDPSSPYTGGAILGDRVRMGQHALDDGVFIRSMATRGHLGGLALATPEAVRVLDAAGFPWVLIETVGVGQVEVEVAGAADTTVVVVNPGWGDSVQAAKAGLMEIADVFVVNKADRAGAEQTAHDLESMMDLTDTGRWRPPVVRAVGTTGEGAAEVWEAIGAHRAHLEGSGELGERRRARVQAELDLILEQRLRAKVESLLQPGARAAVDADVAAGRLDPWSAADEILHPLDA